MNAKTKAAVIKHGQQLLDIFPNAVEQDPIKLYSKLRMLERDGESLGLRLCDGPEFTGGDAEADRVALKILAKVFNLLGYTEVPIFLNRDPRGYALKIKSEWMAKHPDKRLHTDMGQYGILAPDLTE